MEEMKVDFVSNVNYSGVHLCVTLITSILKISR